MSADNFNDRLINSKVVVLFKSLTKPELRQFTKYLEGTSYQKGNDIYALFNFLKKHYPNFCEKKICKQKVCKYIYKNGREGKFLQLCTNLTKVLEDFLIKQELEESRVERDFVLLNALKRRKLDNLFFQKVKKVRKDWETSQPAGIEQLHNQYKLESLHHTFYETADIEKIVEGTLTRSEALDIYYMAARLHLSSSIYSMRNYVNHDILSEQNKIVSTVLTISSNEKYQDISQISLMSLILNGLVKNKYDDFVSIRDIFYETYKLYDKTEQEDILSYLGHFCQQNLKNGVQASIKLLFELTKWAVTKKLFVNDGYFDNLQFQNIVNIALNADESKWALKFIENHKELLFENIREDIVAYCKVICFLNMKKYEKILELLLTVRFRNVTIGITSRCIEMRAYVELNGRDEEFFRLCRNLIGVINRDNLLASVRKKSVLNFIKYAKVIYDLRYQKRNDLNSIEKEIKLKNVFFKHWILQKISSYKKTPS